MSVRRRLEDACVLQASGRPEGALLSVLLAVGATSRKRYPKEWKDKDHGAFNRFLTDEMEKLTGKKNLVLHFRGKTITFQMLLFALLRRELAHESVIPGETRFEPRADRKLYARVTDDAVTFGDTLWATLLEMIVGAPENAGEFGTPPRFEISETRGSGGTADSAAP